MGCTSKLLLITLAAFAFACEQDKPRAKSGERVKENLARGQDAAQADDKINSDKLQLVAGIWGPMPTGIAVSRTGRTFINFPRWGDPVEYTVAELKNGQTIAYPDADMNKANGDPKKTFVSVQSVVVDDQDRLWVLDTGSINFQPHKPDGPKLVCIDLKTDIITKTIDFKKGSAIHAATYLNDIRFDLARGTGGLGFITDSSDSGPNGIIVVDLDTGESWRRLNDHPSTKAEQNFVPTVEGEPLMARPPNGPEAYLKIGSDGIAISGDKKTLYYCPLASRHLYSVSVDALADRNKSDADVAATVKDLGDRGYASDGLETDAKGRIYLTDYEHNAIHVRDENAANDRVLLSDPRMIWPDSLSAAADGFLYFTANQLNRQPRFHKGKDLRKQPYSIFRIPLEAGARMETAAATEVRLTP